jgi:hypothetical protein
MRIAAAAVLALLLGACASDQAPVTSATGPTAVSGPSLATLAQGIALPAGYKVDSDRTTIFGTDERWTGRLTYTTSTAADEVFDFLHKEMPNFGWAELTAMRSDISILSFMSDSTARMATVHIARGGMLGANTRVDMVVTPQDTRPGRPSGAPRPQGR